MKKIIMILAVIAGLSTIEAQGSWMRFAASKALEASSSTAGQIFFGSLPLTSALTYAANFPERTIASLASTPVGKFITPETSKGWFSWGWEGAKTVTSEIQAALMMASLLAGVYKFQQSLTGSNQEEDEQQPQQHPQPVGRRIVTAQELAARRAGARA